MTGTGPSGTVVVVGARGMLGHMTVTVLEEAGHHVVSVSRKGDFGAVPLACDAEDRTRLRAIIEGSGASWVINAAGVLNTAVDARLSRGIYVNSVLPHLLAEWGEELGFRLLHVSTDCVFSGDRGGYSVHDEPDAVSAYGRSKALGEVIDRNNLTIRTSIVGPELAMDGTGLMLWFLSRTATVQGWTESRWTGLTTLELARVASAVVSGALCEVGLWQCVPPEPVTKYQLLDLMNSYLRPQPLGIEPVAGYASDKSLLNDRPSAWQLPTYDAMLQDLAVWIRDHADLYRGTVFA